MTPALQKEGPAVEYLLKEVSFSTCNTEFFGELEKEMLIPNNVNIHGRINGAKTVQDYKLRVEFSDEAVVGFLKQPLSTTLKDGKRILTYKLEELVNFDDYWWFPLRDETVFSLSLNLLPPFPTLNPVDLHIACKPDVAVGLETDIATMVRLEAQEDVDYLFLRLTAPSHSSPGVSLAITEYSDDHIKEPRQSVVSPKKIYPFPRLSLRKGQSVEYRLKTRIRANPSAMTFLRCEQDVLNTKLLALSESSPSALPCSVTVMDNEGREIPVQRTIRSTILQATAQIMYSPFSLRREAVPEAVVPASAR